MKKQEIYDRINHFRRLLLGEFDYFYPFNIKGLESFLNNTTKQELEYELSEIERIYSDKCIEKKTNEYYATDEGSKRLCDLNAKILELELKISDLKDLANRTLGETISELLGENWEVDTCKGFVEIYLKNPEGKKGMLWRFALRWNCPYGAERVFANYNYSLSYMMGVADLNHCDDRGAEYLIGLGKFVNNKDELDKMKRYIYEVDRRWDLLCDEIDKVEKEKKNPLNL